VYPSRRREGLRSNSSYLYPAGELPALGRRIPDQLPMSQDNKSVTIKATVEFVVNGKALEEAFAEYDELTVESLLREIVDKAIACDRVEVQVVDGPNTLEEYDELVEGSE